MSCGERWETSLGAIDMHNMSNDHLSNAVQHAKSLLLLARSKRTAAESDIVEGELRITQLQREVERRNRQKCGIAEYGKALKVGDYVKFIEYNGEELMPTPPTFERGDILRITKVGNGVSQEMLNVLRIYDGRTDSVWPEEVEKVERVFMPTAMHTAEALRAEIARLQRENEVKDKAFDLAKSELNGEILKVHDLTLRAERQDERLLRAQKQLTHLRLVAQNAADDLQTVVDDTR
jgi:hypothetical protein